MTKEYTARTAKTYSADSVSATWKPNIEKMGMDKDRVKFIHRVLDQNEIILEQNAKLLEMLSSPTFIIRDSAKQREYKKPL